jgi:hypothetical protein
MLSGISVMRERTRPPNLIANYHCRGSFMKFVNDNPETPNKPAIATFRPERMLKFSSD